MYQNYPTQAYAMPYTSQASYQQAPDFPASRSYGEAQTGYPPNGPTGYSASWSGASTSDAEMARGFSRCHEHNVLRKYAGDSSGFCEWAVRTCLRKELGYARTGDQQSVVTSQHSLPASQATVIPAKSDRVLCLERRLDLEQKRWRKAERERDRLRESLSRVCSRGQINVLEKGTMRGKYWSPASVQKALHVKVAYGSKGYEFDCPFTTNKNPAETH
ncbi:hypothetical protein MRX96_034918 [Rhipicephalus microplus]